MRFQRPTFRASAAHPVYRHSPTFDGAGAGAFVYEQQTTNPLYQIQGAGMIPFGSLRVTQPPPVIFTGQRGINGSPQIAGQLFTTPLIRL
jgi:hypothetical protein